MVDGTNVIWAEPLQPQPQHSAQKAELNCPHQSLELGAGKKNLTSTQIAERGLLTSEGKGNKKQAGNLGSLGCPDEAGNYPVMGTLPLDWLLTRHTPGVTFQADKDLTARLQFPDQPQEVWPTLSVRITQYPQTIPHWSTKLEIW
ncbi:hypothetical protein EWB00_001458, partial [Schistosoma japonicum]